MSGSVGEYSGPHEVWEPEGDAIIDEISWSNTEADVVLWDRDSGAWLTATLAVHRGDTL
jgi:hypothetical protein